MGCFLIGVTGKGVTKSGEALLGSISDDPYDIRTFVRSLHPLDGIAHVGTELVAIRPPSFKERGYFCEKGDTSRGVNAAGLSFTCALLFENNALAKPSNPTSFSLLTKQLMLKCQTVEEGIELFTNADSVHQPFSVLLADKNGDLAHLEAGSFGTVVQSRYSKNNPGACVAVNCYQSEKMASRNDPKASPLNPINNNGCRLNRGKELFEKWKGNIDIEALSKILSDHANRDRDPKTNPLLDAWGYSICNHGTRGENSTDAKELPWGSVSAEILQPSQNTLWYCYGWPCGEKPEFQDQLLQENSWGKFRPFTIKKNPVVYTDTNGIVEIA